MSAQTIERQEIENAMNGEFSPHDQGACPVGKWSAPMGAEGENDLAGIANNVDKGAEAAPTPSLVMGPVLFHWDAAKKQDFYARIADETDVDIVHVGEVVCAKRSPFFDSKIPDVIERLQRAGKQVVVSSMALVMGGREVGQMRDLLEMPDVMFEANDMSAVGLLAGRAHVIGPYVNVYNEGTLRYLIERGAARICLPWELPLSSIRVLGQVRHPAALEVQIFGRVPLAISARCYSARARGLHKDGCRYVCGEFADGMAVDTLEGKPFLAVNGLQTMSQSYLDLSCDLETLMAAGVDHFRLSPHSVDMVAVAELYRSVLNRETEAVAAAAELSDLCEGVDFANGFVHGLPGAALSQLGRDNRAE